MPRYINDSRSGFSLDVVEGYGKRPAVRIQQRCQIMYLDRGQDRKTLLATVAILSELLRRNEKPLKGRKPVVCIDPSVCRDCGYLDAECRCNEKRR
jgi:predicted Zn-ribbon and HTH transcriptional regulator